jgi:hypothetical protein
MNYQYSFHVDIALARTLGLLIWGREEGAYFAAPGEEQRAREIVAALQRLPVGDVVAYYLERGGGGYESFSAPETVAGEHLLDAARKVAATASVPFEIPPPRRPRCSACGATEHLHLVTLLLFGNDAPGRLLVYCPSCRNKNASMLGVDVPLEQVDAAYFVSLYRDGKTKSAPCTAAEIAFGEAPVQTVLDAETIWKK